MQLVRHSPSRDLAGFERDFEKLFRDGWSWDWPLTLPTAFQDLTTIDMYTEGGKLVVEATLPGFKKEEIKLNANDDALDITAEHKEREEKKAKREYLLHESSRNYRRHVILPDGAEAGDAEAEFADGTLKITMPMEKRVEAKEVAIK